MSDDDDLEGGEPDDQDDAGQLAGMTMEDFYRLQRDANLHAQPDHLLQMFASWANSDVHLTGFSATLITPGAVVSGQVVGRSAWLRMVAENLSRSGSDEADLAHAFREMSVDTQMAVALEPVLGSPTTAYIHVHDATIFSGGQPIANGINLRLRLSEIAGWSFQAVEAD